MIFPEKQQKNFFANHFFGLIDMGILLLYNVEKMCYNELSNFFDWEIL